MALPRHHATDGQQCRRPKTKFFSAEQRCDDDIARELEPSIHPQANPAAKPGANQRAMCIPQADFPGQAGVLDRRDRRGAGAAVMTGDRNHVGSGFRHAGRDNADSALETSFTPIRARGFTRAGRRSTAPGPRCCRCRGAAAARSASSRAPHGAGARCRRVTLLAGSWPPSPGLAPWAILISSSSACTRYSVVTPKRPEATCFTRLLASGLLRVDAWVFPALARITAAAQAVHGDGQGAYASRAKSRPATWLAC